MKLPPAREASVDGRPLYVFDGLAPAKETLGLQRVLDEDALLGDGAASAEGDPLVAATRVLDFDTKEPQDGSFQRWSATLAKDLFGEVALDRCYAQRAHAAANGTIDRDPASADGVIAMWFVCGEWSGDRGGETLFFDDQGEAVICVSPRSGRLVIFDGGTGRHSLPPRGAAPGSCYALVYHFTRAAPRESRLIDSRRG